MQQTRVAQSSFKHFFLESDILLGPKNPTFQFDIL